MGHTHAATGAGAWLTGCAAAALAGYDPGPYVVLVGTALAAFGAIWPDIDHPHASIAWSLGWPTRKLARFVAWSGKRIHAATRTRYDRPDHDGHRTASHTLLFCLLSLAAFGLLGVLGGQWAPLVMVVFATATALRALKVRSAGRYAATAVVAFAAWWWPAPAGWWLGVAIGGGALVHNLGDALTHTGVPLWWPLKIRGQRWFKVRALVTFSTSAGSAPEGVIRFCALAVCPPALLVVAYCRWPQVAGRVDELVAALTA